MSSFGNLASFFNTGTFSDISVKISSGEVLHLHRILLAARSKFFAGLFASGGRDVAAEVYELNFPDPQGVCIDVLRFMYTNDLPLKAENAFAILSFADILLMEDAVDISLRFIEESLTSRNVLAMFYSAVEQCPNPKAVLTRCIDVMIREFDDFIRENSDLPAMRALPKEVIVTILESDELNACEEQSCLNFIALFPDDFQLLPYIRFGYLSVDQLLKLEERALDEPEFHKYLPSAYRAHALLRDHTTLLLDERSVPLPFSIRPRLSMSYLCRRDVNYLYWPVPRFSELVAKNVHCVTSPPFRDSRGDEWKAKLYPCGSKPQYKNYISLYCRKSSDANACFDAVVINHLSDAESVRKSTEWQSSHWVPGWGWNDLVLSSGALNPQNGFLREDDVFVLEVRVRLWS